MKVPAIRARIGDWEYYITTLTFEQVETYVSPINDQLHKSVTLKEMIQRSISSNYLNIADYILNQKEHFFNSLVLAVYNSYPDWIEIKLTYDDQETYTVGLLDFPGQHKIFPIDGQHRVEGIKAALKTDPNRKGEKISAIFVSHQNTSDGMTRTRRLFSTLNRYAKPVTMDDIIALDEDDSIAISTRELLETFNLFTGENVTKSNNKSIPESDKKSFTSIITLYQCNEELLKMFRAERMIEAPDPERDKKSLKNYLKYFPNATEVSLFNKYCYDFWTTFRDNNNAVLTYSKSKEEQPAYNFRSKEIGGNLLFRPVGLLPFIQAVLEIKKRTKHTFSTIFKRLNRLDLLISKKPWEFILWNPNEKTMVMGSQNLVKLILLYQYGGGVIKTTELSTLNAKYADRIGEKQLSKALSEIPVLN